MINFFQNFDLLSVGVAVAATVVLGFVVLITNTKSITNKTFFAFSLVTAIWGIANYVHYQVRDPLIALWSLRFVFFFALWQSFTIFTLLYVFPSEKHKFTRTYKVIATVVFLVSIITLTSLTVSEVTGFSNNGVPINTKGPGMLFFGILAIGLVIGTFFYLIKKERKFVGTDRNSLRIIGLGIIVMFGLIIPLNFILPVASENFYFLPLSAVLSFPFVIFTSYAILKHKLFSIKVASAAILVFLLSVTTFSEVIFAKDLGSIVYRSAILVLVLSFGVLLIKSVIREVRQREEMQRLAKKLSDFISFATHELRGPITAFKGAISMIIEGNFGKVQDDTKRMLNKVYLEAEEMGQTVETFLNMNKIEIGKFDLMLEEQDLQEVVASAVEQSKYRAREKKVDVKFLQSKEKIPRIFFDQFKIKHAVTNLLSNAIKYNNEGGKVRVTVENREGAVIVKVIDDGIGISKEMIPNLFNQYNRGEAEAKRFAEGSGIGLWLTKKVIDLHGGKIWVESKGKGTGSTFAFSLPVKSQGK